MLESDFKISKLIHNTLGDSSAFLFRYCQIGFWSFSCLISYATLTLWYGQYDLPHFAHIVVQALMGLILSMGLQQLFLASWQKSNFFKLISGLSLVLFSSLIWTLGRMVAFTQMTQEQDIWWNFGGWYFTGIFIFSSWTAMFYGVIYYQLLQTEHAILLKTTEASKQEYVKRMEAQTIAKEAQLKMLRYQLNPHFLSNSLNAINALIETNNNKLAQKMVINLSRFLRYSLDNEPNTKVTVEQEVETLKLYLEIEKVRFGERLAFDFKLAPDSKLALIPNLILQPIIENSMKHAIAKNEAGGKIQLQTKIVNNQLIMLVSDSGASQTGISDTILNSPTGVGLKNIQSRLATLYPNQSEFKLEQSKQGGLISQIIIPFEQRGH